MLRESMSVASVRRLGRYALHRQIASGGMASVHLGRLIGPAGFSRTVAIKRLHTQFAQDAHFVTMFLDEARVTGRIVHPNIVSTIDVVQERGELFIVMDFVRGAALSSLVQGATARGERVDIDIAAGILLDALAGLHAAHETIGERRQPLCVVHRDVSPHNILVGADGLSRIADFGIAKARGRMQSTAEGQIKGKLTYMAPEVIRGEDIDRRVDVYASAVVLWELLAGRKLFSGNEASVLYDVLEGTIDPPSSHRADLPPGLDEVVMKGLAKDREDRYATAADLAEAIEKVAIRAPARRIGAWASELAAQDIELRAGLIEDLESSSDDAPPLSSTATPDPASDASPWDRESSRIAAAIPPVASLQEPAAAPAASQYDSASPAFATTKAPFVIDEASSEASSEAPSAAEPTSDLIPRRRIQTLEAEDSAAALLVPPPTRALRVYAIAATGLAIGIALAVLLLRPNPANVPVASPPSSSPPSSSPLLSPPPASPAADNGAPPIGAPPVAPLAPAPSGTTSPPGAAPAGSASAVTAPASPPRPPPSAANRPTAPASPPRPPPASPPPLPTPEPPVL